MSPPPATVRVSVLVTCYQHERYVARALDSVLAQDGAVAFEILVGDDASTDGSRAIIAEYAAAHPQRITTLLPERNLGLDGKALLAELIARARGCYIAKLDADDHWTSPAKLRRQARYLDEHPECSLCFHDVLWCHEDGSRPPARYNGPDRAGEVTVRELLAGNPIASCSALFRRAAIDPLPAWFFAQPWGDWQLNLIAARQGAVRYLPEVMAVHLTHPGGMWSRLTRLQALEGITACQEGMREIVPPELERWRRRALARTWLERAVEHARQGDGAAARRCARESLRAWPPGSPPWLGAGGRRAALWLRLAAGGAPGAPRRRRPGRG